MDGKVGFAVIYRWQLHPGKEEQFRQAWERGTVLLMAKRGVLGSRLHRADCGTWVACAQWRNRKTWEHSRALGTVDPGVSRSMGEAQAEALPPIFLTTVADHLQHSAGD
jgi:Antibiotic biosynthesis monooxygenase